MRGKWILIAPLAIGGLALLAFLGGQIVTMLWNALLPDLFGVPRIGFWQALGLLALCRILFGGFGLRGGRGSRIRRRVEERVAERVEARMAAMTPEELEQFRRKMRHGEPS
jgi:hypothetical protein